MKNSKLSKSGLREDVMLELFKLAIERKLDFIFKLVKRWDRCLRGCRQRGVNGLFTRYTERVLMIQTPSVFLQGHGDGTRVKHSYMFMAKSKEN